MGCCTGTGRIVLIILNSLFFLVSLAILAVGVLLKFFSDVISEFMLGNVNGLSDQTQNDFNIPDWSKVSELPFVGELGLALIIFGIVLFFISFLACCGACGKWRVLLIMFVVLMSLLVLAQAVVGGLFLAKDSVLHDKIKDTVGDKVKEDFKADGDDVFSFAINILNYLLGCCGIRGWDDFTNGKPPSCCNSTIIEGDSSVWGMEQSQCVNGTAPDTYYSEQSCYKRLQDEVLADLTLSALVFSAILVIQLLEIIFACLIVKEVNDDNCKVNPY